MNFQRVFFAFRGPSAALLCFSGVSAALAVAGHAYAQPPAAPPATEKVIYGFKGGSDGANPLAGVISDGKGALYGTTATGGTGCSGSGCGAVFKLTPPPPGHTGWTEQVLYRFRGGTDGSGPAARLTLGKDGALYGTTAGGGGVPSCSGVSGCGTVFRLAPPAAGHTQWTEEVLYRFKGGADGSNPGAELVFDKKGALYGTATRGAGKGCDFALGCGIVFKLTPPTGGNKQWTETVLHSFKGGSDGGNPSSRVIFGKDGALYGTTHSGGGQCPLCGGSGTVYKLTPPAMGHTQWTETVLYSFNGGNDGAGPLAGLIFDSKGALYGTTSEGGGATNNGTVFELTPPGSGHPKWTETVLHRFGGFTDGSRPSGGLAMSTTGELYGTTSYNGPTGRGTLYKLTPPAPGHTQWAETVLSSLSTGSAAEPVDTPLLCSAKGGAIPQCPLPAGSAASALDDPALRAEGPTGGVTSKGSGAISKDCAYLIEATQTGASSSHSLVGTVLVWIIGNAKDCFF